MQVYEYTDAVIDRLNAYACSLPPSPSVSYSLLHPEVRVPRGYLPLRITQFSRWDPITPRPHHWAFFVPTSPIEGIGHYYELFGASPLYNIRSTINDYNIRRGLERGSHTIGFVLPTMLSRLEAHLALVPLQNLKRGWGFQNWVCEALETLNLPHVFAVRMTLEDLITQMAIVGAAWEAKRARETMDIGLQALDKKCRICAQKGA